MTVVVLGLDALDPLHLEDGSFPNLGLDKHREIDTIMGSTGEPSTHELWPTIISGLPPEEHGLVLADGLSWENPVISIGSRVARRLLPPTVRTRLGSWILDNTRTQPFRTPASYYDRNGLSTVFDGRRAKAIGIPNYVVQDEFEDREHLLRGSLGELFERSAAEPGGHSSSDLVSLYEDCMEMAMVRIARTRRALRSRDYELVFGYTSALDLIGHVSYDRTSLLEAAYAELDEFVGELRADLGPEDELFVVSDHGLQDGLHTDTAVFSGTEPDVVESVGSVLDVRAAIESALRTVDHDHRERRDPKRAPPTDGDRDVKRHLENLGYF